MFRHPTAIWKAGAKSLSAGEEVEYDVVQGQHGPHAANVTSGERVKQVQKAGSMSSRDSLALIRRSSELIQESIRLRWQAQEMLSATRMIVGHSRELLSAGRVGGIRNLQWRGLEAPPRIPAPQSFFRPEETEPKPSPDPAATLERIADRDFAGETVSLDGRHFVDCNLSKCVLEYSGGPCILEGTHFTDCRFLFGNEAAMTVAILECFGLIEEHVARATLPPPGTTTAKPRVN